MEEAKAAALRLLSSRSHSRKELKAKLLERGHALDAARAALDRLAAVGLQSDAEFAEVFARSKWRQTKWGPSRIRTVSDWAVAGPHQLAAAASPSWDPELPHHACIMPCMGGALLWPAASLCAPPAGRRPPRRS